MELAEHIFLNRVTGAKPEWIADVLARLVWLTNDNGAEICKTLRTWLGGNDEERAGIALAFTEVFLWESKEEMDQVLDGLSTRVPNLVPRCEAVRAKWLAQAPNELPAA